MTIPATRERHNLADELAERGPDAPTLCGDWDTKMLAAHIILRDSRPDAAGGIIIKQLAGYTERVQESIAQRPYDELIDKVRNGPPIWNPARLAPINRLTNTAEFFVHLEDVRRATDPWEPRELDDDLIDDLYDALRRFASRLTTSAPVGATLQPDGGRSSIVAHDGAPMVTVIGPVGELMMWSFGRQSHSRVTFDGPSDAADQLNASSFGL